VLFKICSFILLASGEEEHLSPPPDWATALQTKKFYVDRICGSPDYFHPDPSIFFEAGRNKAGSVGNCWVSEDAATPSVLRSEAGTGLVYDTKRRI